MSTNLTIRTGPYHGSPYLPSYIVIFSALSLLLLACARSVGARPAAAAGCMWIRLLRPLTWGRWGMATLYFIRSNRNPAVQSRNVGYGSSLVAGIQWFVRPQLTARVLGISTLEPGTVTVWGMAALFLFCCVASFSGRPAFSCCHALVCRGAAGCRVHVHRGSQP